MGLFSWDMRGDRNPQFTLYPVTWSHRSIPEDWLLAGKGLMLTRIRFMPTESTNVCAAGHWSHDRGRKLLNLKIELESCPPEPACYWLLYCHSMTSYNGQDEIFCLVLQPTPEYPGVLYRRNG
jgi:hypothetical protein